MAKKSVTDAAVTEKTAAKTTAKNTKKSSAGETPVKKSAAKKAADKKAAVLETTVEELSAKGAPVLETTVEELSAKGAPVLDSAVSEAAVKEAPAEEAPAKKTAAKKAPAKKAADKKADPAKAETKKTAAKKAPAKKTTDKKADPAKAETKKAAEAKSAEAKSAEVKSAEAEAPVQEAPAPEVPAVDAGPRRSVAFIGSECYPFVKTGGLGDVMYALPKALAKLNCDVKVILPRYKCIPQKYQDKMVYRGDFYMDLCSDGRQFYVGIMEYVWDGVVYDFIDNEEFFSEGKPYVNLIDDIPKYCFFGKAALAALNYMDWTPDIIHCHDWQAGLVPIYLREFFSNTPVGRAKTILTIHNLRFQGIYDAKTIKYWTGLPDYVFNKDCLTQKWLDANMFKGGLAYANMITTVSNTYAGEIQTEEYGEGLEEHLQYHSGKLHGIVNGIDIDIWNPAADQNLAAGYDLSNVLENKKKNKLALQEELGLEQDEGKFVIGLISRLTNQKGLDLVNAIIPELIDGNTQIVVLGTGDAVYEDSFRYYENAYKGQVCSCIQYDEARSHRIYAGADALLVPSRFEPCGLTQLIAMHYGTLPIVRETGGLKDTVEPYNEFTNQGNGFTFDRYDAGLLLDAINRAKTLYFTNRWCWDEMVQRDMAKDVSWENSAKHYKDLYLDLTGWY